MIARRGLRAILIGPSNEKVRPGSKLPEGFNKSACLKLFALDGDRDAMIVGQATTGRNSAAPVSSSSSSVTAEPVLARSGKLGWTSAAHRWAV